MKDGIKKHVQIKKNQGGIDNHKNSRNSIASAIMQREIMYIHIFILHKISVLKDESLINIITKDSPGSKYVNSPANNSNNKINCLIERPTTFHYGSATGRLKLFGSETSKLIILN
jgi:hypothetical protein